MLSRAFYLLSQYPGRTDGDTVWVQRQGDRSNDDVSPVVIGSHDWASAWAVDSSGRNTVAVDGGPRQRTLAYRFGVNLVMYALTGNYKGDQVHVPHTSSNGWASNMQAISAVRFDPTVPIWVLGVLVALCVVAAAPALWRRARGSVLRLFCFAVVLLWLAGPRLVQETREALNDIAVMVVDRTGSMQVGNRGALVDAAAAKLQAEVAQIPGMELRTVTVPEAGHDGTRLFSALDRTLADIPRSRLSGVMMLTDGVVHDVPTATPPVPVHVLIPASGEQIDRRIRVVEAPILRDCRQIGDPSCRRGRSRRGPYGRDRAADHPARRRAAAHPATPGRHGAADRNPDH